MKALSTDTSLEAQAVQFEIYRRMSPEQKLELTAAAIRAGLRLRYGKGMSMDPMEVAALVTDALDQLGIAYFFGGSVASTIYGEPRYTQDVDVVVDLRERHLEPLFKWLGKDFYLSRSALAEAIRFRTCANAVHLSTGFKIDLMVSRDREFEHSRFRRRVKHHGFWVASAEDIILVKLEWFRMGNEVSERQWRDVLAVLIAQDNLDRGYLDQWAKELGVSDLLVKAMVEAGRQPF